MPKIDVAVVPDKTGDDDTDWLTECDRCIEDLLFIQNDRKMYVNEKKQLQTLIMNLHKCNFYMNHETALDKIGYELLK